MEFKVLSEHLEKLENTSSRLAITEILADLFNKSDKDEIDKICYLVLGALAPRYENIVFNIAEKMIIRVLALAYDKNVDAVTKLYKKSGDLGNTSYSLARSVNNKVHNNLSVNEVYEDLLEIAKDKGEDSVERKIKKTSELLKNLDPLSAKFVSRIPVGRLRLGFSDKTVLDALSWMETGGKIKKAPLESAYNILPNVGLLAKEVKEKGIDEASKNVTPMVGVPMLPMLAARLKSPAEMIAKMKTVIVEPKFDGLRIQIHYKKSGFSSFAKAIEDKQDKASEATFDVVKAFTRNLNETSWMFPELGDIGKYINAKEAIFDSEAVGVDETRKKMANFQTTMTRRRKHDIEETASKISIKFEVFDIMFKDGKSLVQVPYDERRKELAKTLKNGNFIEVVDFEKTESPKRIEELMQMELGEGLEGIIIKRADSKYIAGRTGYRWVKMKEKEGQKAKLADTLDLIVMGYFSGRGKRTAFGMGGFLVGTPDGEVIKTLTKIGTGLTDDQFREMKKRLKSLEVKDKPKEYGEVAKILIPDTWVIPSLVVEIAADDITKSPNHSSGFALRFPRLVKFRDDRDWTEATTLGEIKKLFKLQ